MKPVSTCLQLDVGNSSAKWRLLRTGEVLARGRYVPGDDVSRDALLGLHVVPEQIWISSVAAAAAEAELAQMLTARWGVAPWFAKTTAQCNGLVNSYAQPARMGVDRWLAMLGARARHAGRVCVVDAGSALTVDLVAADGRHEGGYIIPGASLMERALLLDTERVRFDEAVEYSVTPGRSTAEAVRHGIALAQVGAVGQVLAAQTPDTRCFICGGDAADLMSLLQAAGGGWPQIAVEAAPDLVFEGLALARAAA